MKRQEYDLDFARAEPNANVDVRDEAGNTPLHGAVHWERLDIARLLLENNANANAKNKWGRLPST